MAPRRITEALLIVAWLAAPALAGGEDPSVRRLAQLGIPEAAAERVLDRWARRFPESPPTVLLDLIEGSAGQGAPVDLVVGKAAEGLAKGVPEGRLVLALKSWSRQLGEAARTARKLRRELRDEAVDEREAILRLSVLQRMPHGGAWLASLEAEARANETDLRGFLRVGEAVGHLTVKLGMDRRDAESIGRLMMRKQVPHQDVGKLVRAIELSRERSSLAEAAEAIREKILLGVSPDDVLQAARAGTAKGRVGQKPGGPQTENAGTTTESTEGNP